MTRRRILGMEVSPSLPYPDLVQAVRAAEDAGVDFVMLPDVAPSGVKHEALAVVAALSTMTSRIGLVPGVSLALNDPFNLARALATLDHLTGGRVGWFAPEDAVAPQSDRAAEFLDVVRGLHDSWDDGAIPRDKMSGLFFDRAGMRVLSHAGTHFRVRGPLDVPTSPQRQLPFFADLSFPELAERHADVLVTSGSHEDVAIRARSERDIRILRNLDADDPRFAENLLDPAVDGVIVHCKDLSGFVRDALPGLGHQPGPGGTLRALLGLAEVDCHV